jgi:hypothetical protein
MPPWKPGKSASKKGSSNSTALVTRAIGPDGKSRYQNPILKKKATLPDRPFPLEHVWISESVSVPQLVLVSEQVLDLDIGPYDDA